MRCNAGDVILREAGKTVGVAWQIIKSMSCFCHHLAATAHQVAPGDSALHRRLAGWHLSSCAHSAKTIHCVTHTAEQEQHIASRWPPTGGTATCPSHSSQM